MDIQTNFLTQNDCYRVGGDHDACGHRRARYCHGSAAGGALFDQLEQGRCEEMCSRLYRSAPGRQLRRGADAPLGDALLGLRVRHSGHL